MRKSLVGFLGGALLLASTSTASAHHAFAAEFDWKKPVTISGTVTKVEWNNPHTLVYVNGKDESGNTAMWKFELGSPQALTRYGWTRTMLKEGEQITVDGWLAKDGSKSANAKTVNIAGKELFAASSFFDTTPDNKQSRR